MPNWCYNTATFYHEDKTVIDGFEQELSKEDAQPLNYLRPNPSGEWEYDWSVSNWGTKWDISPHDWQREDDNTIVMHFDSAWSPPTTIYEFLSENGWSVRAYYHEPGMAFVGRWEDGDDDCYEYDITDRESCEIIPDDILDFSGIMDDVENYEEEQYQESIADLERTDWFDVSINPDKVGRYEVKRKDWEYVFMCDWDGEEWKQEDIAFWRGVTESVE